MHNNILCFKSNKFRLQSKNFLLKSNMLRSQSKEYPLCSITVPLLGKGDRMGSKKPALLSKGVLWVSNNDSAGFV